MIGSSGASSAYDATRAGSENAAPSLKSQNNSVDAGNTHPAETTANPAVLETRKRLASALHEAGRSSLGMPGSVDTFLPWLKRHGLVIALAPVKDPCPHDHDIHRFADDGGRL